jgi:sulfur-oxidizing protein SoxY
MSITRRKFINLFGIGAAAMLMPFQTFAAWASAAFNSTKLEDAYKNLFGDTPMTESKKITLKVPKIAENGGAVPITIKTTLEKVETINIFVKDNPQPLTASFHIPEGTLADVSTRIRLAKTSTVTTVIKADGALYSQSQEVKVTIGGCGG